MNSKIDAVAASLFSEKPPTTLFHYTSIDAVAQILPSKTLWASEVQYLNDAQEIKFAAELLRQEAIKLDSTGAEEIEVRRQLVLWLGDWLVDGYWSFVVCFTQAGDLLSQWRGYTPHGRGVSLGFSGAHLQSCAARQKFSFGRCVYTQQEQTRICKEVVAAIVSQALEDGPSPPPFPYKPSENYYPLFNHVSAKVIKIAALLKHRSFCAEAEWRAVLEPMRFYLEPGLKFRVGRTTLIPYKEFSLESADPFSKYIGVDRAIIGPTPHPRMSAGAIAAFLSKQVGEYVQEIVELSVVPYRET